MNAFVARVPRATRSRFPRYNTARATLLNGEFRVGSYCVVAAARGIALFFFYSVLLCLFGDGLAASVAQIFEIRFVACVAPR